MRLIGLTEIKKENSSDDSGFVETPALVNANEIVQVVTNQLSRSGPHIIGQGPAVRRVSTIISTAGTQICVTESIKEILEKIPNGISF